MWSRVYLDIAPFVEALDEVLDDDRGGLVAMRHWCSAQPLRGAAAVPTGGPVRSFLGIWQFRLSLLTKEAQQRLESGVVAFCGAVADARVGGDVTK